MSATFPHQCRAAYRLSMLEAVDGLGWNMTVTMFARLYWFGYAVVVVVTAGTATVVFRVARGALVGVVHSPLLLVSLFMLANLYTLGVGMAREALTRRSDVVFDPPCRQLFVAVDLNAAALFVAVVVRGAVQQFLLVTVIGLAFLDVYAEPLSTVISRPELLLGVPLLCLTVRIAFAGALAARTGTGRGPLWATVAVLVPVGFLGARQLAQLANRVPTLEPAAPAVSPAAVSMVVLIVIAAAQAVVLVCVARAFDRLHRWGWHQVASDTGYTRNRRPAPVRTGVIRGYRRLTAEHLRTLTTGRPGRLALRSAVAASVVASVCTGAASAFGAQTPVREWAGVWLSHGAGVVTFLMALAAAEVVIAAVGLNTLAPQLRWAWEISGRRYAGVLSVAFVVAAVGLVIGGFVALAVAPLLGLPAVRGFGAAVAVMLAALWADSLTEAPERPDGTTVPSLGAGFLTVCLAVPVLALQLAAPSGVAVIVTALLSAVFLGGVMVCGSRRVLRMQLSS